MKQYFCLSYSSFFWVKARPFVKKHYFCWSYSSFFLGKNQTFCEENRRRRKIWIKWLFSLHLRIFQFLKFQNF